MFSPSSSFHYFRCFSQNWLHSSPLQPTRVTCSSSAPFGHFRRRWYVLWSPEIGRSQYDSSLPFFPDLLWFWLHSEVIEIVLPPPFVVEKRTLPGLAGHCGYHVVATQTHFVWGSPSFYYLSLSTTVFWTNIVHFTILVKITTKHFLRPQST